MIGVVVGVDVTVFVGVNVAVGDGVNVAVFVTVAVAVGGKGVLVGVDVAILVTLFVSDGPLPEFNFVVEQSASTPSAETPHLNKALVAINAMDAYAAVIHQTAFLLQFILGLTGGFSFPYVTPGSLVILLSKSKPRIPLLNLLLSKGG
ncbi:MAG TPA: hypothetical protein V6D19_12145 [Stenomitos sp.]